MAHASGGPGLPLPPLRRTPLFREKRTLFAGPAGWTLVIWGLVGPLTGAALHIGDEWTWLVLGCILTLAGATFSLELLVTPADVRVVWWRVLVRHRIDLRQIRVIDVTVADNVVDFFGGYNSRTSMEAAMLSRVEGDRSVGNKAIRIHTIDGRTIQVGCWQPRRFREAVTAAQNALPQ